MDMQKAKDMFGVGAIAEVSVARAPLDAASGWIVAFRFKAGNGDVLETALGRVKVFSSLDTLYGQVEKITGRPVRHAVLGL